MSEMPNYIEGVPCWVDTLQPDPDAAANFYGKLFGWTFAGPCPMPNGEKYFVAQLKGRDVAGVASMPAEVPRPCWSTYVLVDDIEAACRRAREAGGMVLVAPTAAPPAGTFAVLRDPTGGIMGVWQAQERAGAQMVNAPACWTMNQLTTGDAERAAAFYKAVFGWETQSFGEGGAFTLFRLPNYVGGVPQQPVARDVVAVMNQGDGDAYWSVDFRVSDVDTTADLVAQLGGVVVVAPFDTGFSRNAVLQDPQGAVFSIHSV